MKKPTPKPKAPAASVKDGKPVKFTGTSNPREHRAIHRWQKKNREGQ